MVRFLEITNCVLRLTVMPAVLKVTVSPATALLRAARNEPAPLSAPVVTVIVARLY
ncbi:hypothetical protein [Pseudomonas sp. 58 R 3]|nr:hypothetical protein [Pseudomonas sp. 58 R 3]